MTSLVERIDEAIALQDRVDELNNTPAGSYPGDLDDACNEAADALHRALYDLDLRAIRAAIAGEHP